MTWISSDTKVAQVNSSGQVKALSAGIAKITCTTQDANKTATCIVDVDFSTGLIKHKSTDKHKVNIFPNPITGTSFNIEVDGEFKNFMVKIADLSGKVLFQKTSSEKLVNISRNIFASKGIYLVSVGWSDFEYIQKISCY